MNSPLFSSVVAYAQQCERQLVEILHLRPNLDRKQVSAWVDEQSHAQTESDPLELLRAINSKVRAGKPLPWE
ncbi:MULTISPECIES: hypothetical protein [Pseudomonas]|jgi:hypothetical protein|uniref:Uncharacterized protein n=1 Tax=Pseudomonas caspiana TaxID=1451454 RepID=A0A1Y3P7V6_9PSED|nr:MULTISPECIES: hypothetical protein [Pseudomonas]MCQ2997768.1 hypothetical protein [Pseudomonas syringae]RMQ95566.1 hypothetical protein ALP94_01618 [Pseudomonas savastanoi pv. glycinea]MCQ3000891.1 hypothetical protein [Pseudomonas syringae]MCQ3031753.1 hypothetical protein [Pseudomonas syringae]MDG6403283.1 hypothetical protein [Pseudomonas quasicaspiana]